MMQLSGQHNVAKRTSGAALVFEAHQHDEELALALPGGVVPSNNLPLQQHNNNCNNNCNNSKTQDSNDVDMFIVSLMRPCSSRITRFRRANPRLFTCVVAACTIVAFCIAAYTIHYKSLDLELVTLDLMECTHEIFTQHNVSYFLDYGSLLGAVRHGGFIPWDDMMDIDIGVLASQTNLILSLKQEFSARGCGHLVHRSDTDYLPDLSSFVIRRAAFRIFYNRITPIYIDVADYEDLPTSPTTHLPTTLTSSTLTTSSLSTTTSTATRPVRPTTTTATFVKDLHHPDLPFYFAIDALFPARECGFAGRMFMCPKKSEYVLEREFGSDWRVPKKDFKPEDVTDALRVQSGS